MAMVPRPYFQIFKDRAGQYWWRLRAANHQIIGNSAESYVRKDHALHMARFVRDLCGNADIFDETGE